MKEITLESGDKINLNLTTRHFASEQWMDWTQDRRRLQDIMNNNKVTNFNQTNNSNSS